MSIHSDITGSTDLVDNQGCNLITGQSCDCPSRKGNTVNCTDVLHSEVIGQKGGHVTVAAAVSGIYNKQQNQYQDG